MKQMLTKFAIAAALAMPLVAGTPVMAFDNTAHAWTKACHTEFGTDAKYPDAKLLDKCLNWGSKQNAAENMPAAHAKTQLKTQASGTTAKRDNVAHAWTAACKREFGPGAKYPDAKLLDLCLSF